MTEIKESRESILDNKQFKYSSLDNDSLETLVSSPLKKNIFSLPDVEKDKPCFHATKQFKTYNTIRRDLRTAYNICGYTPRGHNFGFLYS